MSGKKCIFAPKWARLSAAPQHKNEFFCIRFARQFLLRQATKGRAAVAKVVFCNTRDVISNLIVERKKYLGDMCQTALISRNMVRLSKRTYSHRLEVVTPNLYRVGQLARLNRDLDALYELVYDQWRTVTEEDYKVFGGQFKVLLETIKDLYNACRKAPKELGLKDETRKLGMNYSALYEVNSDIVNWNIKAPKNEALKEAMRHLAEVDMKKYANG